MPVGKAGVGPNFMGLAQYLRSGTDRDAPDRVAWSETRNLVVDRLESAARIMQATAHQNPRVEKPVYHLSISWPEEDHPTRDDMRHAADRLLNDLRLDEHQAVLVAHNDTRHPHVHLMVNRVHPETLKAWDRRHDWRRIDQSLHRQEHERQWRQVPRRHLGNRWEEQARPTSGERQQARRTGAPTPAQQIRHRARAAFREARSWADLEYRLDRDGLRLRPSGRGLVVTDGHHYARASSIHRDASLPRSERRFNERYSYWKEQRRNLRQLARKMDRHPARQKTANRLEDQLKTRQDLSDRRRRDLERRAKTLRGGDIDFIKVFRRIRSFSVRWEERIVWWVSPDAGRVLRTYNRTTAALLRPVERGVERAIRGRRRSRGRGRERGRGRGYSR